MSKTPNDKTPLQIDLTVDTLGEATHPSPLELSTQLDDEIANYTPDGVHVLFDPSRTDLAMSDAERMMATSDLDASSYELVGPRCFELAGPRERTFFEGPKTTAAILTCGGLCPGLNNIIRDVVLTLWHHYGVRRIYGVRYGYRGLAAFTPDPPIELKPASVAHIHMLGGTTLGSSRGPQKPGEMVDTLQRLGVNLLIVAGGDGGMRGAKAIYEEVKRRELSISVVGVPKTIDNDLPFIERTFGFDTAVSIAVDAIQAANVEATGAPNGVGLVKLMGRHSGYIASAASLASRDVNLVLVPELPFTLEAVYAWLRERLAQRGHAVIVVAEGAGQEHLETAASTDASGNVKLGDIGLFLRDGIKTALSDIELNLKYIDPSYIIRAAPANPADAIFCSRLAEDAVHAAMAGKTGMVIGMWMHRFTHVPLSAATTDRKRIPLDSQFWRTVVDSTGQPAKLR
ncbi:MAG: diphosphate--fructose-6-phosphate 1-phosphotransferase [Proteobacteria bacterium]|nr:MAG: diphosphate--fructose-6-phosphate 1-phosphotransferase [Pseudomonadota bacterium]